MSDFAHAQSILDAIENEGHVPTPAERRLLLEMKRQQERWNATRDTTVELSIYMRLALLGVA